MSDNTPYREILQNVDLPGLVESYGVKLRKDGPEYVGLCPFHNEKTPSFHVNQRKGLFRCWGCGEKGSAIDFTLKAEALKGRALNLAEVRELLASKTAGGALPTYTPTAATTPWEPLVPVPVDAPEPDFRHYQMGLASAHWAYRTATGELVGYVARYDLESGKDLRPWVYAERNGKRRWQSQGFPKPRPLYGLPALAERPDAPVCIVEGEKTADAVATLLPASVVLTWAGGAKSMKYVDWAPLRGRRVILWPDADKPGTDAMCGWHEKIDSKGRGGELVKGAAQFAADAGAEGVRFVRLPEGLAEGWDGADALAEGWDVATTRAFLAANVGECPAPAAAVSDVPVPAPKPTKSAKIVAPEGGDDETPDDAPAGLPFRPLGYRKGAYGMNEFYIYSYKARQALKFGPSNFTKAALIQLADISYWARRFRAAAMEKAGWESAAGESLMNACYSAGYYDAEKVRGIGAWLDNGRVVVHAGTHLVADNEEYGLATFPTSFIYEAERAFGFNATEPLKSAESERFYELANLMNWERPGYADLFLGWCIIAPMCGALTWRPHLWITGGKGTGKSAALTVMHELVGKIALRVQGTTTEAAIRQLLASNARPVFFDEADSDSRADNERLQGVLSLVRAASSFDGGAVAKGTAGGGTGTTYLIRSCFAFASITPKVQTGADRSRVTVLSLIKRSEPKAAESERWEKMQKLMAEILTPENCERLQARTLALLPQILANAKTFTRAAALVLGEQRAGDQLGVMLAGAYSLKRKDVVDFEAAKAWLGARNWDEIRNEEKDEESLLSVLMEQPVRVESQNGVGHNRTVGELVELAAYGSTAATEYLDGVAAHLHLKRIGIKVDAETKVFYIANKSLWLSRSLATTAWATNYNKVLARLHGAIHAPNMHFSPGLKSRAVGLPLALLGEPA